MSSDGGSYDGEWQFDTRHGFGKEKYSNGGSYEGYFKNDSRSGKGQYIHDNGQIDKGDYENGLLNGHGNISYAKEDEHNRNNYTGELKDGEPHGKGKMFWKDGSFYDGEWEKGVIDGFGTKKTPGLYYEGFFKDGHKYGKGKNIFGDGEVHEGDYENGLLNGHGNITYANDDELN